MPTLATPTRKYSVVDAINRISLATGSCSNASRGHSADYNGHKIMVDWNSYRKYWVASYTWAGREVLRRGTLAECLEAAMVEHNKGALGSQVIVLLRGERDSAENRAICSDLLTKDAADAADAEWYSERHKLAGSALRMEQQSGIPYTRILMVSADSKQYDKLSTAYASARRQQDRDAMEAIISFPVQ